MKRHFSLTDPGQTIETKNMPAWSLPRFLQMAIEESAGRLDIAQRTEGTEA